MVAKTVAQDFGLDLDRRLAVILSLAPQANNLPTQQQLQPQMDAQTVVLVSGPEQGLRQVVLIKSAPLDNIRIWSLRLLNLKDAPIVQLEHNQQQESKRAALLRVALPVNIQLKKQQIQLQMAVQTVV